MSTATFTVTPRWASLLKRFGLAALFLLVLAYLIPRDRVETSWPSHPSLKTHDGEDGIQMPTDIPSDTLETDGIRVVSSDFEERIKEFEQPVGNKDWGLMAKHVQKLTAWAENARTNNESPKHLDQAVLARFPYLKGSKMYRPWNYEHEDDRESLAKTGIVMCVGSRNFHLASHLIASLRDVFHSEIPIEVAYAGDNDLNPKHRQYMKGLGRDITFIDLLEAFPEAKEDLEGSGWAMKPYSMLASKHKHVMLVDADALFLTDPSALFDTHPDLNRTGTLLFHDRAALGGGDEGLVFLKEQIVAAGKAPSPQLTEHSLFYTKDSWYEADSGLVAIDKSRTDVFISILFVTWLNTKSVRDEVSYKLFYGDKETFWIAMELCGVDYFFQPWYAGSMGKTRGELPADPDTQDTELCSTHMLHMDHTGESPFWINGGIYEHKDFPDRGFADISHYWKGNTDNADQPNWLWEEGNVACLKKPKVKPVPSEMLDNLHRMYEAAAKIDNDIKQLSGDV